MSLQCKSHMSMCKTGCVETTPFTYYTSYPISEGWANSARGKFNEGNTKFLYAMKLVPPKDPGSIVHPDTIH